MAGMLLAGARLQPWGHPGVGLDMWWLSGRAEQAKHQAVREKRVTELLSRSWTFAEVEGKTFC